MNSMTLICRLHDRFRFRGCSVRPSCLVLDVSSLFPLTVRHPDNASRFGPNHLRAVWRISLGLGVVPAFAVFLWRLRMVEPERYRKDSMKRAKIPYLLVIRRYWRRLAILSTAW
jgi:hypothetical protein